MHWLAHWLGLDNASGPVYLGLSGFVGDLSLLAAAVAFVFHKQCEVRGCPRLARHVTAGQHRVCRRHSPTGAPTHAEVIAAHEAASTKGDQSDAGI